MDRVQIAALAGAVLLFGLSLQLGSAGGADRSAPSESRPATRDLEPGPEPGTSSPSPEPADAVVREDQVRTPAEATDAGPTVALRKSTLDNGDLRLRVSNLGWIESAELPHYASTVDGQAGPVQLVTAPEQGLLHTTFGTGPVLGALAQQPFEVVSADARSVVERRERAGVEVVRTLTLDPSGYGAQLRLRVANRGTVPVEPRLAVALYGRERPSAAPDRFQNAQLTVSQGGSLQHALLSGIEVPGMFSGPKPLQETFSFVDWVAVESQYFLAAVTADSARDYGALEESFGPQYGRVVLTYPVGNAQQIPPGQQIEKVYRLYLGPKLEEYALGVDARLGPSLRVGWAWVRPLVVLFAGALQWIYENLVSNYGVAIILLTIVLRVGTFPLTQRSMRSMKRLSTVAPQMKELQEKYRDDSERMQQEMMALYRRTGVNPFSAMAGGCLPMLLQMPFMIALYYALQGSIELRHAGFCLWIDDLSAPETFLSVLGVPIRPLPLLMGGSMVLQQWLTPSTGDEQQQQQRKMMMLMSGVFTVMFYQFPAGLVLYWLVSNLLGIGQQLLVNREPAAR